MSIPTSIIGILLAAGSSSRMGQPKQLLNIKGKTLIEHTLEKILAISLGFPVISVLGARAVSIAPYIKKLPTDIIINENWEQGMGTSLVAALKHIENYYPDTTAILLSVCDQPYLTTTLLQEMIEKHLAAPQQIITARYTQSFGVPAILPKRFFPALATLQADKGAKKVMHQHSEALTFIEFPKGDFDFDTLQDYQKWCNAQ